MSRSATLLVILAAIAVMAPASTAAGGLKIHFDREEALSLFGEMRGRRQTSEACTDKTEVTVSASTLPDLVNHVPSVNARVKAFNSTRAESGVYMLLGLKVPGLNGATIKEVLDTLRDAGCLSYLFGGSVRDQFIDGTPNDADVEMSCSTSTLLQLCELNWGEGNCLKFSNSMIVHIGNEAATDGNTDIIDTAPWDDTFYGPPSNLEYTVNSLAYDVNQIPGLVIDFSGMGVEDVCAQPPLIRIPSDSGNQSSWDAWQTRDKVYRFWKLRIKGFSAADMATLDYITSKAKQYISSDGSSFSKFYCSKAYAGTYSNSGTSNSTTLTCTVDKATCQIAKATGIKYDVVLSQDLGNFWTDIAALLRPELKCSAANMLTAPYISLLLALVATKLL